MTIDNSVSGQLGHGTHGSVVKAERNGQDRAVKIEKIRQANEFVQFGDTRREQRTWAKLSALQHPNILRLHETYTHDG